MKVQDRQNGPSGVPEKNSLATRLSTACNLATTSQIQPQSDSRTNNCMREIVKAYTGKDTRDMSLDCSLHV